MYNIDLLNKISEKGLSLFTEKYEYRADIPDPDGILVRSKEMKDMTLPSSLKAIARAGAGVNNIPIDKCSEKGIVVFNTPGANANGVKELVILGMLLACRNVVNGITWAKGLVGEGDKVPDLIEKGKSKFTGTEIMGKKLGIVGLGLSVPCWPIPPKRWAWKSGDTTRFCLSRQPGDYPATQRRHQAWKNFYPNAISSHCTCLRTRIPKVSSTPTNSRL